MIDLYDSVDECRTYDNGHKYCYDVSKSTKEEDVFTCICGSILNEFQDTGTGC